MSALSRPPKTLRLPYGYHTLRNVRYRLEQSCDDAGNLSLVVICTHGPYKGTIMGKAPEPFPDGLIKLKGKKTHLLVSSGMYGLLVSTVEAAPDDEPLEHWTVTLQRCAEHIRAGLGTRQPKGLTAALLETVAGQLEATGVVDEPDLISQRDELRKQVEELQAQRDELRRVLRNLRAQVTAAMEADEPDAEALDRAMHQAGEALSKG